MTERQRYHYRHTKGSYHSSAATADSLDTEDTLATDPATTQMDAPDHSVQIEGLDLLLEHQLSVGDDQDNDDEEEAELDACAAYARDTEIDSLVLARRRLHRIWIHRPPRRRSLRKKPIREEDPTDSIKLAKRRIPQCVHQSNRTPRQLPRREEKLEVSFPDLEPMELTPPSSSKNEEDDDSVGTDYSWDSLADKTVDSLELTRSRMERLRRNPHRQRKLGTDLLCLGLQKKKAPECAGKKKRGTVILLKRRHGPLRTRFQGMVPLRQHSDGVVKLQASYRAAVRPPVRLNKVARHNSDGRLRTVGRAA